MTPVQQQLEEIKRSVKIIEEYLKLTEEKEEEWKILKVDNINK
jgi:hypothetical protein